MSNNHFFRLVVLFVVLACLWSISCGDGDDVAKFHENGAQDDDDDSHADDDDSVGDDDDDVDVDDDDEIVFECSEDHPERTVGLIRCTTGASEGYTLFAPIYSTTTYLIDMFGQRVHSWEVEDHPFESVYLTEDGLLMRTALRGVDPLEDPTGKSTASVQTFDWDGTKIWDYKFSGPGFARHHDIEPLPNGNVLLIADEVISAQEAIDEGRDPKRLEGDQLRLLFIVEVQPTGPTTGDIVWEWHVRDHLVQEFDSFKGNFSEVKKHPERVDLNFPAHIAWSDWIHANSIDYLAEHDQIVITSRHFNEFWVIDHSTSSDQAATGVGGTYGQGGNLLYRWGNPASYGLGSEKDQMLSAPHDATMVVSGYPGSGDFLIFNNGEDKSYSSIVQITPPRAADGSYKRATGKPFGPSTAGWRYIADPPSSFFSPIWSGAQRLPNGNTLICCGVTGRLFEVNEEGEVLWEYIVPVSFSGPIHQGDPVPANAGVMENATFKVARYTPDYPGLAGRDLEPKGFIELP